MPSRKDLLRDLGIGSLRAAHSGSETLQTPEAPISVFFLNLSPPFEINGFAKLLTSSCSSGPALECNAS